MGVSYGYHKSLASFLRLLVKPRLHLNPKPDEVALVPSRDDDQTIKTHIYKPATQTGPTPVLINFCGSGFVLRTFGSDDEYCRFVADNANYTVIDVQYRLAPEHPFPAAFHDAEDVVNWVRSQPDRFDLTQLSLSGFSAGANIALAVASASEQFNPKQGIFDTVISFYGPMDMSLPTPEKPQADRSNWIMRDIFPPFSHLCHKCLNLGRVDPKDPRMSPILADPNNFPNKTLIITAAQDPFAIEAEELSKKLNDTDGKVSVCERMEGCAHGWDKEAIRGTSQCDAKDEAYQLAVKILRQKESGAVPSAVC
ncbi:hypothetical protein N7522_008852 [Penicillium canescens]|nr:hypothetical protein N7522_008852 [Penicillium canescens]